MPPAYFVDSMKRNAKEPPLGSYVTGRSNEPPSKVAHRSGSNRSSKRNHDNDSEDKELIRLGENHFRQDRLLAAARIFRTVKKKKLLQPKHLNIMENAQNCEVMVAELKSPVSDGWTKIGESHGDYDTVIYFKMEEDATIVCRLETPIEPSLLVPMLSVLNETELYQTWTPSWKRPVRIGVTRSDRLQQTGRASQIVLVTCDVPWPLSSREGVISALAFEDIDNTGDIFVRLQSRQTGDEGGIVPPPDNPKTQRVQLQGGILFRKCPWDHPTLRKKTKSSSRTKKKRHHSSDGNGDAINNSNNNTSNRENLILVSVSFQIDAKIHLLPQSAINFILRTVIGVIWARFLQVAEDVRDGRRPQHADAISEKREVLYDWVDETVQKMVSKCMDNKNGHEHNSISREDMEFIHYLAS